MSCNCECDNILSSTAELSVSGTSLLITPTISLNPDNEQRIKILISNSVPTAGASLAVVIALGGDNVAVLDRFGNTIYGNQLYKDLVLKGYFGNNGYGNTSHFQLIKVPFRCK